MSMRSSLDEVTLLWLVIGLAVSSTACSSATPEQAAPLIPSAPPAPVGSLSAGVASASPVVARSTAKKKLEVTSTPVRRDLDGPSEPLPCDFNRPYRGTIQETPVSLVLHAGAGGKISGLSHYDRDGGSITITGKKTDAGKSVALGFDFAESPGGKFTGSCDPATGVLSGSFDLGGKHSVLKLNPLPADWPGLYQVQRTATMVPNHPACALYGNRDNVTEVSISPPGDYPRAICPPGDPTKRRAWLADPEIPRCSASDHGYRVFGLSDATVEKTVNGLLGATGYEEGVKEIQICDGHSGRDSAASIVYAGKGVLVLSGVSSMWGGGGKPMTASTGARVYDLIKGDPVLLDDIVSDEERLRTVAGRCIPVYDHVSAKQDADLPVDSRITCEDPRAETFLWGCPGGIWQDPMWALTGEGLVIDAHTGMAFDDQEGPILSWSALLAADALRSDSPLKRLWEGEKPSDPRNPVCNAALEKNEIRRWSVVDAR